MTGNQSLLKDILKQHEYYTRMTTEMNEIIKYLLLVFYYNSIPCLDLLIIIAMNKEIDPMFRTFPIICSIIAIILLWKLSISLSSIPTLAHKPYNGLHSIIVRKTIPLQLKLKVYGLIEKLSGHVIGFYCYELFPFTNYEFYLYITNCIKNFILIKSLFNLY